MPDSRQDFRSEKWQAAYIYFVASRGDHVVSEMLSDSAVQAVKTQTNLFSRDLRSLDPEAQRHRHTTKYAIAHRPTSRRT